MTHWWIARSGALLLLLASSVVAAAPAADVPEPGSTEEIAAATTEARFMSPWVSSLPFSATVPSPRAFLHRIPGAPGELVNSAQAYAYARALAAASPRVRLYTIGRSEEGRDILMLAIADEDGIQNIDRLKAATAQLADPRLLDAEHVPAVLASARPIYYFNAALHSDETGSTESVLELAYRLAVSEQPMIRRIRSNLVVLINPVANPDGRDKQVEWFYRYLKGKTVRADLPRQSPPYWGKYVQVDVNRDAHQLTQSPTQAVSRMFFEWHPTIVHDLHEEEPLLLSWNGTGPFNPHIDALTFDEFLEFGFHDVQALTSLGMPGAWTWNFGDGFGHMFADSVAMNHNAIGRGFETYGNGSAETMLREPAAEYLTREWYRLVPAPPVFMWSARDNINYNVTGALVGLDYTAAHAQELLANFYQKGLHSWRKGLDEAPFGFLISAEQGDPARVAALVGRLLAQGIEVGRATAPFKVREGEFAAGTYVVRLDQPYRNYAVDLLTPQQYPANGGEAYEDVSWELPAHFHLQVVASADPAVREVPLSALTGAPAVHGLVSGTGAAYLLRDTGQEALLEARFRLANSDLEIAERAFQADGRDYPAGSWIIPMRAGLGATLASVAADLGLDFVAANALPNVPRHRAPLPRIGVWVPWADTDSIGWLRYSLDQRHIPYGYVRDEDVRAGRLHDQFDVLLYGHVDLELAEQIYGIPKAWGPMAFKKTTATPSQGTPAASDDITGGIGGLGLAALQAFVEQGGLMVTLGNGSMLALEGGIVRGVRRDAGGVPRSSQGGGAAAAAASATADTRTPGAHVRVSFARPDHPIAYGYPARTHVFRQNFALYATPRRWMRMAYCNTCLDGPNDASGVVLEWGDRDAAPLLVSGQVWGESNLIGRPAILDMPVGAGHVITFNFNPMHRDMNRGDQRMLWNALINWRAIIDAPRGH